MLAMPFRDDGRRQAWHANQRRSGTPTKKRNRSSSPHDAKKKTPTFFVIYVRVRLLGFVAACKNTVCPLVQRNVDGNERRTHRWWCVLVFRKFS